MGADCGHLEKILYFVTGARSLVYVHRQADYLDTKKDNLDSQTNNPDSYIDH